MRYPTVSELFFTIESKMLAYNFICSHPNHITREHLHQLRKKIEFDYVASYYFMMDRDEVATHLDYLIAGFKSILATEGFLSALASADGISLEFAPLYSVVDEYRTEINTLINDLDIYRTLVAKEKTSKFISTPSDFTRKIFKASVYKGLANLTIDDLSVFEDNDNPEQLLENIKHFVKGDFESITPALNFIVRKMQIGYYLLTELKAYCDFDFSEISNVEILSKKYVEANRATALTKLRKAIEGKILDSRIANEIKEIDSFITTHTKGNV